MPSNIAEGAARQSDREFLHFLSVARGSLAEIQTQLIIARKLGYTTEQLKVDELIDRVFHLINGLHAQQKRKSEGPVR